MNKLIDQIKIYNFFLDNQIAATPIINKNGNIDIAGDIKLKNILGISFKFEKVTGSFDCSNCNLTSLDFAPDFVGGNFDCSNNNLISLENAPEFVGGDFDCSNNQLTSWGNKSLCIVGDLYYSGNPSLPTLPETAFTNTDEEIDPEINAQKFQTIGNISIKGSCMLQNTPKKSLSRKNGVEKEENNKNEEKESDPHKKSLLEKMISEKQINLLMRRLRENNTSVQELCQVNGVKRIQDLTMAKAREIIHDLSDF